MIRHQWTVGEERALAVLAPLGLNQVAEILGRTPGCVKKKAHRLGVSVKKETAIYGTELSPSVIEYVKRHESAMLCPACGLRLVGVRSSGLCGVCHFKALSQHRQEEAETQAAIREHRRISKQLLRAVNCKACGVEFSPRLDREGRKSDRELCPECRGES